jgi:hypothetical protein
MVSVDDSARGVTPLTLAELSAGSHIIKLMKKGFFIKKLTVQIQAGTNPDLAISLTRPASLLITSTPSGAAVMIDGKAVGTTPFEDQKLKPGTYDVGLQLAGHAPYTSKVTLADGGNDTLAAALAALAPSPKAPVKASPAVSNAVTKTDAEPKVARSVLNKISLGVFVAFSLMILLIELAGSSK